MTIVFSPKKLSLRKLYQQFSFKIRQPLAPWLKVPALFHHVLKMYFTAQHTFYSQRLSHELIPLLLPHSECLFKQVCLRCGLRRCGECNGIRYRLPPKEGISTSTQQTKPLWRQDRSSLTVEVKEFLQFGLKWWAKWSYLNFIFSKNAF